MCCAWQRLAARPHCSSVRQRTSLRSDNSLYPQKPGGRCRIAHTRGISSAKWGPAHGQTMASIVGLQGIGQHRKSQEVLAREWRAHLRDDMRSAGCRGMRTPTRWRDRTCIVGEPATRPKVRVKSASDAPLTLSNIEEDFESDLSRAKAEQALPEDPEIKGAAEHRRPVRARRGVCSGFDFRETGRESSQLSARLYRVTRHKRERLSRGPTGRGEF
jgi:hypothetical protein